MNKKINKQFFIAATVILFLQFITGCTHFNTHSKEKNSYLENTREKENVVIDTTPKVTGIGGIFFKSKDPKKAKEWYGENLGLTMDAYGSVFETRNINNPEEINFLRWSPFDDNTTYFDPSKKEFMINYRVQNIERLVEKLKANGVTIVDTIETFEYGKFVHLLDVDGNKLELWEPNDSFFTNMKGKDN